MRYSGGGRQWPFLWPQQPQQRKTRQSCILPKQLFWTTTRRSYNKRAEEESPCWIDVTNRPDGWQDANATVYPRVIDRLVGKELASALDEVLKRKTYSKFKRGAVMDKFRGFHIAEDDEDLFLPFQPTVFDPIRTLIRQRHLAPHHRVDDDAKTMKWLPPHVIDLHRHGGIRAHVDNVTTSEIVAGLSLKSSCILRLRPVVDHHNNEDDNNRGPPPPPQQQQYDDDNTNYYVDLLLEPLSLYVLQGDGRYKYTHETLPDNHVFNITGDRPKLVSRGPFTMVLFRVDNE